MPAVSERVRTQHVHAVVLAAGKGTRLRSDRAKVLHDVAGQPLLAYVLDAVERSGVVATSVVVGHQAELVQQRFAGRGRGFVLQEPPRGTGHALLAARDRLADADLALVLNGDLPFLQPQTLVALLEARRAQDLDALLLTAVLQDGGAYGRVVRARDGSVLRIVEARDASPQERALGEVNVGVYLFRVAPLLAALARLRPDNTQGEYYLTDVVGLMRDAGARVGAHPLADPSEGAGVNTQAEVAAAAARLYAARTARLMDAGVTVEDPASLRVGPAVEVAADAVLRPFTLLEGATQVAAGAVVGPFVRLVDTQVGPDAQVLDHCLLRGCVVEQGASVGPFTHVRPESRIGARARVGNFVELKKTALGEGSKAPHLSYLGDATVGPGVNVGAGTITCNYDGHAKYPTHIEAGAFVGSHATLVAPLTVGAGAYIAAGSVVTEDVPADALALGRARQAVKPDWARRRRETRGRKPGHD
jgi:bifunctional UDP-N-acetylglucosamine pyrophosphorylase/glucosamine-1-phosphate N-acetyltransferase